MIDLNCDMGESFGRFTVGNDENIFPYITSCNIACGFHGGDPVHMERTIGLALKHGVQIGAHPSYPDLNGFGRRKMQLHGAELKAILKYQIAALKGMVESMGGTLAYVKPHGALYNTASNDENETTIVIEAIREISPDLAFMGLAESLMGRLAKEKGMGFIAEAFADRRYHSNGRLVSRSVAGSVIHDPEMAVRQVLSIVRDQSVTSMEGERIAVRAQSVCIHGDNPAAVAILRELNRAFETNRISKKAFAV